jgi:histidyl-tRNA synthetase
MDNKFEPHRIKNEFTEADLVARFYGFKPINSPTLTKADFDLVKNLDQASFPAEKAALLRVYFEEKLMALPQPVLLYSERPFAGSKDKKRPQRIESSLISLGSTKSVCECLAIQTAISILHTIGYKDLTIHVNSIGDKESMNEFQKNLMVFIKKNFNSFPTDLRQAIKKDPFVILKEDKAEWQNFQNLCPKSIDFLSEASRLHFKEVLEFLEIMEVAYVVDHHLLGDSGIGSETVFAIKETDGDELAYGFRFNRLAKKIGYKKELACNILNISAKLSKPLKKTKSRAIKPQFYLIQFGAEAKLQSFLILRDFFKAKINIIHTIDKDKLGGQMNIAELSGASHIILIGQKDVQDRNLKIMPIPKLKNKKLKMEKW